jgi:CBS domain-containing protein
VKVDEILRAKGTAVETIPPYATVQDAVLRLDRLRLGALVVSADGTHLQGLISERDIVHGLATRGRELLQRRVVDVMSRRVPRCSRDDTIASVMQQMTRTRFRHIPVVDDDRLCGLVSIGDVVKHRLEELELESRVLRDAYLSSSSR